MAVPGVLAALVAKLAGAGTAAKAALATATAVTTLGLAGGAAGVLPAPAQNVVATAVGAATPFEFPDPDDATGAIGQALPGLPPVSVTLPTVPNLPVQPPVSVAADVKAGSTSASAQTGTSSVTPTVPNVTVPSIPGLPQVSIPPALSGLVNGLPACVKDLVPTTGSVPDPTTLAAKIQACIPQVLSTANVPAEVKACISSVLGTIGGAGGLNPSTIPGLSGLSLSSCAPMDMSKCVTNMMGFLGTLPGLTGGGIPGIGSFSGFGDISGLPGLSAISGCVPMDINKCITSITSAVSAGTVPRLDLSACMPTTLPGTGTIPGFGSFSNLPGLSTALSFFGR